MRAFEWVDARSVEEAAALLAASSEREPVIAKAGGMDLLDLIKEGIVAPSRVVNLRSIRSLEGMQFDGGHGLRLGALVTLAQLARQPQIRDRYIALAEAAAHAATPQVRNAATIGGNLLQRPRCWYFRNEYFHRTGLHRTGGSGDARTDPRGEHQYGAIFDNSRTAMVHASTPATALIAYRASVHLANARGGSRQLELEQFLLPPDMSRDRDALIERDEILTHLSVPAPAPNTFAAYHKQTERDSYDWPICDAAVVLQMSEGTVAAASIVLGWVAPTPRRASGSEELLVGREIDESVAAAAARAAVQGATPLANNGYKVAILEAVVRRTILAAAAQPR